MNGLSTDCRRENVCRQNDCTIETFGQHDFATCQFNPKKKNSNFQFSKALEFVIDVKPRVLAPDWIWTSFYVEHRSDDNLIEDEFKCFSQVAPSLNCHPDDDKMKSSMGWIGWRLKSHRKTILTN